MASEGQDLAEIDQVRLTLGRCVLSLLRIVHRTYMGEHRSLGRDVDTMLVCIAVYVGHIEGRPMTANKLAHFLEMPRSTVLRRLAYLRKVGDIRRMDSEYVMTDKVLGHSEAERSANEMISAIRQAYEALPKMDSKTIDSPS